MALPGGKKSKTHLGSISHEVASIFMKVQLIESSRRAGSDYEAPEDPRPGGMREAIEPVLAMNGKRASPVGAYPIDGFFSVLFICNRSC